MFNLPLPIITSPGGMATPFAPVTYQRLPGAGSNGFLYVRLYRGQDHLLQVASSGFTETYKRFYFADIQAIVLQQTMTGRIGNVILGGLALTFFLISLAAEGAGSIVVASIGVICLVLLASNALAGPTCICHVSTAVQRQKLGSLGRVRRARAVVEALRPEILRQQEAISREEIAWRLDRST